MLPFLVGLGVGVVATGASIPLLARLGMWDVANTRSSHSGAIARGGGLGVIAGVAAGVAAGVVAGDLDATRAGWVAAVWILVMAAIGLTDDLRGMPVLPRLLAQLIVATVAAAVLVESTARGWATVVPLVVGAVWLVSYVNAFNFMDGINGISALSAAVAGGWYAWLGDRLDSPLLVVLGLAVAGASLGFLPWNLPRARVFLGDVGSYGVGGAIAMMALVAWLDDSGAARALAPLAVYLADTGLVLVKRAARGQRLVTAHRDHVYQRLVDNGWSHTVVAVVAAGAAGVISVGVAALGTVPGIGFGVVVLVGYLALPGLVTPRQQVV
jgi:UDP-N-acetylmuramyl pentapeptide phosphotransferase/UDP-N-acetylglucosamine-1-phosphate transferase